MIRSEKDIPESTDPVDLGKLEPRFDMGEDWIEKTGHRWEIDDNEMAAILLYHGVLMLGYMIVDDETESVVSVVSSDIFAWATATTTEIKLSEIPELYDFWAYDNSWGSAVWCMKKEKLMPQKPVYDAIMKGGKWDLDSLKQEWGLRENGY